MTYAVNCYHLQIICVTLSYSQPIMCCLIYIPPNSPAIYYDNLFDFFSNIDTSTVHIILIMLLGDFNLPDIDRNTLSGTSVISNQFCDFVFDTGLCQLINGPTHVHGNTLDLLLTNIEENIHSLLIHSQQRLLPSDHYGRTFRLASKLPTC